MLSALIGQLRTLSSSSFPIQKETVPGSRDPEVLRSKRMSHPANQFLLQPDFTQ
jgi:hypothetical protein